LSALATALLAAAEQPAPMPPERHRELIRPFLMAALCRPPYWPDPEGRPATPASTAAFATAARSGGGRIVLHPPPRPWLALRPLHPAAGRASRAPRSSLRHGRALRLRAVQAAQNEALVKDLKQSLRERQKAAKNQVLPGGKQSPGDRVLSTPPAAGVLSTPATVDKPPEVASEVVPDQLKGRILPP